MIPVSARILNLPGGAAAFEVVAFVDQASADAVADEQPPVEGYRGDDPYKALVDRLHELVAHAYLLLSECQARQLVCHRHDLALDASHPVLSPQLRVVAGQPVRQLFEYLVDRLVRQAVQEPDEFRI